jgi:hypothetical protein
MTSEHDEATTTTPFATPSSRPGSGNNPLSPSSTIRSPFQDLLDAVVDDDDNDNDDAKDDMDGNGNDHKEDGTNRNSANNVKNASTSLLDLESMPPLLTSLKSIPKPIIVVTEAAFQSKLQTIHDALSNTDPDAWKERLDGLDMFLRVIAGGSLRRVVAHAAGHAQGQNNSHSHSHAAQAAAHATILNMVQTIKNLPMDRQIEDLRSTLTGRACQVVIALAYEIGVHLTNTYPPPNNAGHGSSSTGSTSNNYNYFATLTELWLQSLMKLSISGTKVMANQGIQCIRQFTSFEYRGGALPRLIPVLCEAAQKKKNHPNLKLASLMGLSSVLRQWHCSSTSVLERKYGPQMIQTISTTVADRDPTVREEGRKAYWSLFWRMPQTAEKEVLQQIDPTAQKHIHKLQPTANAEWLEGGIMYLLSRGHDLADATRRAKKQKKSTTGTGAGAAALTRPRPTSSTTSSSRPTSTSASTRPASAAAASATPKPWEKDRDRATGASANANSRTTSAAAAATGTPKPWQRSRSGPSSRVAKTPGVEVHAPLRSGIKAPRAHMHPNAHAHAQPNHHPQLQRKSALRTPARRVAPATAAAKQPVTFTSAAPAPAVQATKLKAKPKPKAKRRVLSLAQFLDAMASKDWSRREKVLFALTCTLTAVHVDEEDDDGTCGDSIEIYSLLCASSKDLDSFIMALANHSGVLDTNLTVSVSALEAVQSCLQTRNGDVVRIVFPRLNLLLPALLNKRADFKIDSVTDMLEDCFQMLTHRAVREPDVNEHVTNAFLSIIGNHSEGDADGDDNAHNDNHMLESPMAHELMLDLVLRVCIVPLSAFCCGSANDVHQLLQGILSCHERAHGCGGNVDNDKHDNGDDTDSNPQQHSHLHLEETLNRLYGAAVKRDPTDYIQSLVKLANTSANNTFLQDAILNSGHAWAHQARDEILKTLQVAEPAVVEEEEHENNKPLPLMEMEMVDENMVVDDNNDNDDDDDDEDDNEDDDDDEDEDEDDGFGFCSPIRGEPLPEDIRTPLAKLTLQPLNSPHALDLDDTEAAIKYTNPHTPVQDRHNPKHHHATDTDSNNHNNDEYAIPYPQTPFTDPVLRYMVRPSPFKHTRNNNHTHAHSKQRSSHAPKGGVDKLLQQLSITGVPTPELYIAMQDLLHMSRNSHRGNRDNRNDNHNNNDNDKQCSTDMWNTHFDTILACILRGIHPHNHLVLERHGVVPMTVPMIQSQHQHQRKENQQQQQQEKLQQLQEQNSNRQQDADALVAESCHLFLQGLRILLKYQSQRFESCGNGDGDGDGDGYNNGDGDGDCHGGSSSSRSNSKTVEIINALLQCCREASTRLTSTSSSTSHSNSNHNIDQVSYVVHAAEKALEDVVKRQDPSRCLDALLSQLQGQLGLPVVLVSEDESSTSNPNHSDNKSNDNADAVVTDCVVLLAALRTLLVLIPRLRLRLSAAAEEAGPAAELLLVSKSKAIFSVLQHTITHKSVDIRKNAVLCFAEIKISLDRTPLKSDGNDDNGEDAGPHPHDPDLFEQHYLHTLAGSQKRLILYYANERGQAAAKLQQQQQGQHQQQGQQRTQKDAEAGTS